MTRRTKHPPHLQAFTKAVPMQILTLIPLEPHEWQIKLERGIDGLFDHFRSRGRDLFTLRAPSRHESSGSA